MKKGRAKFLPTACRRDGDRIVCTFGQLPAQVVCAVSDHGRFFKFDVESFIGKGIEELRPLNLHVTGLPNLGRVANLAWNDEFGVAVMALNLQTKAGCPTICDTYQGARSRAQPCGPFALRTMWRTCTLRQPWAEELARMLSGSQITDSVFGTFCQYAATSGGASSPKPKSPEVLKAHHTGG